MLPRPQGGCSLLRPCEGNREPGDLALPGASPHLMHFTPKQGEELRHPNQALLSQVLCAYPCLILHNFSLVCWKVVHSLVNYAHGGVTTSRDHQFQAPQDG